MSLITTPHEFTTQFPSPCGVLVLKWRSRCCVPHFQCGFPSPCGVLVLKCNFIHRIRRHRLCFRPLAGFWFLNASPCEALWCLDKNAILRRGGVVGAKSSVRLFKKLLCPPSCLVRRRFLSRAWVSPQDFKRKHGRAIAPPHSCCLLCAHRELDELVAEFSLL